MNKQITIPATTAFESFPRLWDERGVFSMNESHSPNHSHACGMNVLLKRQDQSQYESFPYLWDELEPADGAGKIIRIIPTPVE